MMKMDAKTWAFLVMAATLICSSCAAESNKERKESISVAHRYRAMTSTITVTTQAELVAAIATANIVTGTNINVANDIAFTIFTYFGSANTGVAIDGATNLVINGGGHTISGDGMMRCFYIGGNSASVTFNDMTVTKGSSTDGGAFYITGTAGSVTLNSVNIIANTASSNGGALYVSYKPLTMKGCTVSSNSASYIGGAIYNNNAVLTMVGCTVSSNLVSYNGGPRVSRNLASCSLFPSACSHSLTPSGLKFPRSPRRCRRRLRAGGIANYNNAVLTMEGCTVSNNSASSYGGPRVSRNLNSSSLFLTACPHSSNPSG
jgi:hypothetical protein